MCLRYRCGPYLTQSVIHCMARNTDRYWQLAKQAIKWYILNIFILRIDLNKGQCTHSQLFMKIFPGSRIQSVGWCEYPVVWETTLLHHSMKTIGEIISQFIHSSHTSLTHRMSCSTGALWGFSHKIYCGMFGTAPIFGTPVTPLCQELTQSEQTCTDVMSLAGFIIFNMTLTRTCTDRTKGAFRGAKRAIQAYSSLFCWERAILDK